MRWNRTTKPNNQNMIESDGFDFSFRAIILGRRVVCLS